MKNKKQQVMDLLYKADIDIDTETILWAASNLPDSEDNGEFDNIQFDHSKRDIFDACGLTEKECLDIGAHLNKVQLENSFRFSEMVEHIFRNDNKKVSLFMLVYGMRELNKLKGLHVKDDVKEDLIEFLRRKLKGED